MTPQNASTKEVYTVLMSILKHRVFTNGTWEYLPVQGGGKFLCEARNVNL